MVAGLTVGLLMIVMPMTASADAVGGTIKVIGPSVRLQGTWLGGSVTLPAPKMAIAIDDADTPVLLYDLSVPLEVTAGMDYVAGEPNTPIDHLDKIRWILAHSQPAVSDTQVLQAAGADPTVNAPDVVVYAGTQAAIWHFTDGWTLTAAGQGLNAAKFNAILAVYDYLINEAVDTSAPTLTLSPNADSGKVGDTIGPFTVTTSADQVTLSATDGAAVVGPDGTTPVTTARNGDQVWVVPAAAGRVSLKVTATQQAPIARTFVAKSSPDLYAAEIQAGTASIPLAAEASVTASPVADAHGPYTVAEGGTLDLTAHRPTGGTCSWDVNGDGTFGDATGCRTSLNWAQLVALGIDDGPATVDVAMRATADGDDSGLDPISATDTTTLTVTDTAPTASISGDLTATVEQPFTIELRADDPSPADAAGRFDYTVDWGDGTPVQHVTGPADPPATHTYASSGTFTASVTATDKDGQTGATQAFSVTVDPAAITATVTSEPTTPSPTPTSSSTPTTSRTPPTSPSATTSPTSTSTGTSPSATTSPTSTSIGTSTPTTSAPATTTPPPSTSRSTPAPTLPTTGVAPGVPALAGLLLLVVGGGLARAGRRRSHGH